MSTPPGDKQGLVFLVEDDEESRALVERWCERAGFEVEPFGDAESCVAALSSHLVEAVCLDLGLPGMDGLSALRLIRERAPNVPVVVLTANREVTSVVDAMKAGAYDYLTKPLDGGKLVTTLRNAVEKHRMTVRIRQLERTVQPAAYAGIIGRSPAMQTVLREIDQVAGSEINVLILGESGTGKELVASALHAASDRASGPFVAVNCAAIPDALVESEFFGHEKGAFTGAGSQRKGRLEQANGGTLFLDELGELGGALQAKLLRVIQERRFCRVGGNAEIRTNFRLLTATHHDLASLVRAGRFREDLYFRVAVFELELPPLRARAGDVRILAESFVRELGAGRDIHLGPQALSALEAYPWPGNVRELHNVVQRAVVVCPGSVIGPEHFPSKITTPPPASGPGVAAAPAIPARARLEDLEREALIRALERSGGNVSEVVRELGIGRTTVYRKMKQYKLR